jgi:hypothetical protein
MPSYVPTPNYAIQHYPMPLSPNYSMPPQMFPALPNPSYEPPSGPNGNQKLYVQNPLVRSPRDFFMWGDVQQDKKERERRPLSVP